MIILLLSTLLWTFTFLLSFPNYYEYSSHLISMSPPLMFINPSFMYLCLLNNMTYPSLFIILNPCRIILSLEMPPLNDLLVTPSIIIYMVKMTYP